MTEKNHYYVIIRRTQDSPDRTVQSFRAEATTLEEGIQIAKAEASCLWMQDYRTLVVEEAGIVLSPLRERQRQHEKLLKDIADIVCSGMDAPDVFEAIAMYIEGRES